MNHLRDIIVKLADEKIDFVIAGGVACVLHGVERFTLDLDLSVGLSSENLERFVDVMKKVGLVPRVPVDPHSLVDEDVRNMMLHEKHALVFTFIDLNDPRKHVDMFLAPDLSYEEMNAGCEQVDIAGRKIKIASIPKLLELKEAINPPRDKDQLDIAALRRLLKNG